MSIYSGNENVFCQVRVINENVFAGSGTRFIVCIFIETLYNSMQEKQCNSHANVAEVTESVFNDVGVFVPVKDSSQEPTAGFPGLSPSHGGLGWVGDGGDKT